MKISKLANFGMTMVLLGGVAEAQTGDQPVMQSQINRPNGVAGLDDKGNVTSSSRSDTITALQNLRVSPVEGNNKPNYTASNAVELPGYSMWFGNNIPLGSYGTGSGSVKVQDSWITPPETLHLGGQVEGASGFLNVHCTPYASGNAGTCAQFMMGTANILGQAAGLGPSVYATGSYGGFDAANTVEQTGGSTPLYIITSNKAQHVFPASSDTLDHTPTFTSSGATFANPLPADLSAFLVSHPQGIRLMTNEIGCQKCDIKTYAGGITNVTTNSDGLVTGITVGGWNVPGAGGPSGQIPGQSTTDGSTASLDTEWSNFGAPAIMVGVFTHAFNTYSLCALNGPTWKNGMGDINIPSGGSNNQLRICEGQEMDLLNNDPVALRPLIRGLTIAYGQGGQAGGQPSYDSYDVKAAGANSISYAQSGEYWTLPFSGANFKVSSYQGTPLDAGSVKNVVQWRQSENIGYYADGGYLRNNIMPGMWTVRNVCASNESGSSCESPVNSDKDITTNIGVQTDWYGANNVGPDGDPLWNSPLQEHIELNPASGHNGINLCAGNQTDTNCILQTGYTQATIGGSLLVKKGMFLAQESPVLTFLTGSADSNNSAIQIQYDLPTNTVNFTNNHYGNNYAFNGRVAAADFKGTLMTPSSSGSTCEAGQFADDTNYHYVCVATNKWKRVALSDF